MANSLIHTYLYNPALYLNAQAWAAHTTKYDDAAGKKRLDMRPQRAQLAAYMDVFEAALIKYAKHRCTWARQKLAATLLSQNIGPGVLVTNMDFAESFSILYAREL